MTDRLKVNVNTTQKEQWSILINVIIHVQYKKILEIIIN